jgi:tetratricopeptide (TPR) repeat protein
LAAAPVDAAKNNKQRARAKEHFAQAEKYYRLGQFEAALAGYEKAYDILPLPDFLFNMAQCQRQLGRCKEAIPLFEAFLRDKPDADLEMAGSLIDECREKLQRQEEQRLRAEAEAKARIEAEAKARAAAEAKANAAEANAEANAPPNAKNELLAVPVTVASSAPLAVTPPPPVDQGSVLQTWWFWTIVGAGAVAAGVGIGVAVDQSQTRTVWVPPTGSMGTIDIRR